MKTTNDQTKAGEILHRSFNQHESSITGRNWKDKAFEQPKLYYIGDQCPTNNDPIELFEWEDAREIAKAHSQTFHADIFSIQEFEIA